MLVAVIILGCLTAFAVPLCIWLSWKYVDYTKKEVLFDTKVNLEKQISDYKQEIVTQELLLEKLKSAIETKKKKNQQLLD